MWDDEAGFTSPSGLSPAQLGETLVRAHTEAGGGRQAAVELLRRCGSWLSVLDAAGFIAVGGPHPRDPEQRPRAVIGWGEVLAAAEHGGVLRRDGYRPDLDLRILRIAVSLAGEQPGDLGECLVDLDRERTRYVMAAVESATQAHVVSYPTRLPDGWDAAWEGIRSAPRILPWPEPEEVNSWQQTELPLYPARIAEEAAAAWAQAPPVRRSASRCPARSSTCCST